MQTSVTVSVTRASNLVGVDSGGTCDPYFIMEVVDKSGSGKVTYKSKKVKKETSPIFGDRLTVPGITRKQIASGFLVGKPVIIDFFDWNQFQKHTFLGRALIEINENTFATTDSVILKAKLNPLKENEVYLTNSKVKKTKANTVTSPVEQAKGSSKKNLHFTGLGEVEVVLTLDDLNISDEHLAKIQQSITLSSDKITKMYASYMKSGKSKDYTIKTTDKFIQMLNDCSLFESIMLKWNGTDPTSTKHWDLLKADKDFMAELCGHLFRAFDIDGDGTVSFDEFCSGIFYILEGNVDDSLKMRFRSIDTDHSGFIDMQEAIVLAGRAAAIIRVSMMVGLHSQKYELMRCGLTENDFMPLITAIENAFTHNSYAQKEAKLLFKYCDKDNNGQISEDEYIAYMKDPDAQAERQREIDIIMKPVLASITVNVQAAMIKILSKISR